MHRSRGDASQSGSRKVSGATESPYAQPENTLASGVSSRSFYGRSKDYSSPGADRSRRLQLGTHQRERQPERIFPSLGPASDRPQHRNASTSASRGASSSESKGKQVINIADSESDDEAAAQSSPSITRRKATRPLSFHTSPAGSKTSDISQSTPASTSFSSHTLADPATATAKRKHLAVEADASLSATTAEIPARKKRSAVEPMHRSPLDDTSRDPIDLLTPEVATTSEGQTKRLNMLGKAPSSSKKTDPVTRTEEKTTIKLQVLTVGDKEAFPAEGRQPSLTFTNNRKSFSVEWYKAGMHNVQQFKVELSDVEDFRCQREGVDTALGAAFKLYPGTNSSHSISTPVPSFDPRGQAAWIFLHAQETEAEKWLAFCTWLKSIDCKVGSWLHAHAFRAIYQQYAAGPVERYRRIQEEKNKAAISTTGTSVSALRRLSPVSPSSSRPSLAAQMKRRSGSGLTTGGVRPDPAKAGEASSPRATSTISSRPKARPLETSSVNDVDTGSDGRAQASHEGKQGTTRPTTYSTNVRLTRKAAARGEGTLMLPEKGQGNQIISSVRARHPDALKLRFPFEGPGSVSIFDSDCDRLLEGEFLNDTIVEFGLKYHLNRLKEQNAQLHDSLYCYNSFFYRQLHQGKKKVEECYAQVRKWTAKVDIFSKDYLVIPINENLHWYLAIVVNPGAALHFEVPQRPDEDSVAASETPEAQRTSDSPAAGPLPKGREPSAESQPEGPFPTTLALSSSAPHQRGDVVILEDADGPIEETYSQLSLADKIQRATKSSDAVAMSIDDQAVVGEALSENEATSTVAKLREMFGRYASGNVGPDTDEARNQFTSSPQQELCTPNDNLSATAMQTDSVSNIENHGRGGLIGGGGFGFEASPKSPPRSAQPPTNGKKAPAPIRPGDSMNKRLSQSPPYDLSQPAQRPKARPFGQGYFARNGASASRSPEVAKRLPSGSAAVRSQAPAHKSCTPPPRQQVIVDLSPMELSAPSEVRQDSSTDSAETSKGTSRRSVEAIERDRNLLRDELVVLTLDSLGGKHTAVNTAVTHYLRCEAWDKLKMRIKPQAKYLNVAVPEQPNFADCGLFVLLFFERFFRCPLEFRRNVIPRRDAKSNLWGAEDAQVARAHWRTVIDDLALEWSRRRKEAQAKAEEGVKRGKDEKGAAEERDDEDDAPQFDGAGDDRRSSVESAIAESNSLSDLASPAMKRDQAPQGMPLADEGFATSIECVKEPQSASKSLAGMTPSPNSVQRIADAGPSRGPSNDT